MSFSDNSTNAAKTTTAQFHEVGTYPLRVVIQDAQGLGVTSDLTVEVYPVLTSIVPTPRTGFVSVGGTQQFTPHAYDQFGYEMTPYWFWSVSGGGTITADGLFTAGSVPGEFVVTLRQSVLYVHRHRDVPGHTIDHGGESPISAT